MARTGPTHRELRFFGLVMLAGFAYAAFRAHHHALPVVVSQGLLLAGATILALSFVAPALVRPLYRGWMALGHALGRITTPLVLTVLFLAVFVPTRVFLALAGRDPLGMRPAREKTTWWIERSRTSFDREDFERLS